MVIFSFESLLNLCPRQNGLPTVDVESIYIERNLLVTTNSYLAPYPIRQAK
jgi:hypothetical protein